MRHVDQELSIVNEKSHLLSRGCYLFFAIVAVTVVVAFATVVVTVVVAVAVAVAVVVIGNDMCCRPATGHSLG